MSLNSIREQIKVIISAVPGVGVVHDHLRFSNTESKFLELFKDQDGKINGCFFSREKFQKKHGMGGRVEKAHVFVIRRIMALKDADETEIIFDSVNELLSDAFDTDDGESLNGACATIHPDWGPMAGSAGINMEISEPRLFGSVLCHYAELRLCAVEIIN